MTGTDFLAAFAAFAVLAISACESGAPTSERGGVAAGAAAADEPGGVEAFVRTQYAEGLPYEAARRLGPGARPRLEAMLGDPAESAHWSNIVGAIGIIGGPRASDVLVAFVESQRGRVIGGEAYRAALSAVMALGYVANGGDAQAMNYLSTTARGLASPQPQQPADGLRLDNHTLGQQAIVGLGLSGRPEARTVLRELQRVPAVRDAADEALATLATVETLGLSGYYARN